MECDRISLSLASVKESNGVWQIISVSLASDEGISSSTGSDKVFLDYWRLTQDFFNDGCDKGFLYRWSLTKDFFMNGVWQMISLTLASDKGCLYLMEYGELFLDY